MTESSEIEHVLSSATKLASYNMVLQAEELPTKRRKLECETYPKVEFVAADDLLPTDEALGFRDAIVATIYDKRNTTKIMKLLCEKFPLKDIMHLKRIKSQRNFDGDVTLQVILTVSGLHDDLFDNLKKFVGENVPTFCDELSKIQGMLGELTIRKIPTRPAQTKAQFEISKKYWPVSFHEDKEITKLLDGLNFSKSEIEKVYSHMSDAIKTAQSSPYDTKIGAVVVDPDTNTKLCSLFDLREANIDYFNNGHTINHPSQHACMVAIDIVARQQHGSVYNYQEFINNGQFFMSEQTETLSFRLSTFVMNAVTLRYISRDELGVVNVRLLLLYSTALFLSREAFRKACLSKSSNSSSPTSWKETINLLWTVVPIGVVCCAILSIVWINLLEVPDPFTIPYYSISTVLFAVSVIIELCAEPLWIVAQAFLFVKLKVVSEGVAMIVKCIATASLVIFFPNLGILSFSFAQVLYSMIYALIYFVYFFHYIQNKQSKDKFPFSCFSEVFPHFTFIISVENKRKASLVISFFKQSFLKQFLTEGERYVMTILNVLSFSDQGVYDIVNNLGSLAPRFIFLPIEESYYVFFAKLLQRGEAASDMSKDVLSSVQQVLFCLLRLVSLLGCIFLAFGYAYSFLLLDLYGGSILSEGGGPTLLRAYCVYVLLLAINGTTECFVFAAMDQRQVDGYNKKMLLFSGLFLLASYFFTLHLGSVGFILANCVNMGIRVIHSIYFINKYFGERAKFPLSGIVPEKLVIFSLVLSFVVCATSEKYFCCNRGLLFRFIHVSVGGICLLCVFGAILLKETVLINFLKSQYFKKKLQ